MWRKISQWSERVWAVFLLLLLYIFVSVCRNFIMCYFVVISIIYSFLLLDGLSFNFDSHPQSKCYVRSFGLLKQLPFQFEPHWKNVMTSELLPTWGFTYFQHVNFLNSSSANMTSVKDGTTGRQLQFFGKHFYSTTLTLPLVSSTDKSM